MTEPGQWLIACLGLLAGLGMWQALAGWLAVRRTVVTWHDDARSPLPAVTVLKPLHGDEPMLEQALETIVRQDYPTFQIVFGVQDPADPAIGVVERLRAQYPIADIVLVVDPTQHGRNRKIGNLINMLPAARHDILVIADSDIHARSDYLRRLVGSLGQPGVGLTTVLYAGLPASHAIAAQLGATQITHGFLPGTLFARAIGRQDCLGATMALNRQTLARTGGLETLAPHLADDNVLGQRVRALGLRVALADTVVATTVPEESIAALFRHELRWARTIRALVPLSHAASIVQYPMLWAAPLVWLTSWGWAVFLLSWLVRAVAARGIDRSLAPMLNGLAFRCPVWLLPARDALSVAVWLVSHAGTWVDWRGQGLHADTPSRSSMPMPPNDHPAATRSAEGLNPR